jgi:hypothetical protein
LNHEEVSKREQLIGNGIRADLEALNRLKDNPRCLNNKTRIDETGKEFEMLTHADESKIEMIDYDKTNKWIEQSQAEIKFFEGIRYRTKRKNIEMIRRKYSLE